MSTQRREDRWQRTNCTNRAGAPGVPGDSFLSTGWGVRGHIESAPIAQKIRAYATVGTAPPHFAARLATNSLQSDRRTKQLVGQVFHGSPPSLVGNRPVTGTLATCRLPLRSFLLLPHSSPSIPPRRISQQAQCRWMERYDGKRNLHLQHAA
jgi:hypothetical protein